jgi:hypothetical protein
MFTKKDFELVAEVLRKTPLGGYHGLDAGEAMLLEDLADNFAAEFKRSNPRFDRDRFVAACGITEE